MVKTILVSTDDNLRTAVDTSLCACGSLLDAHLRHSGLDGLCHSAELLDFLYVLPCLVCELVCQALHIV